MRAITILVSATYFLRTTAFNWDGYPDCAQSGFQANAPPACDLGSLPDTYKCLCADSNFLRLSAFTIYESCGCDIMALSAQSIVGQCGLFGGGSALSEQAIIAWADGESGTCSPSDAAAAASSIERADTPSTTTQSGQSAGTPSTTTQSGQSTGTPSTTQSDQSSTTLPGSLSSTTSTGKAANNNDSPESDRIALGIGIGFGIPTFVLMLLAYLKWGPK